jgi:PHD/YefM family antitoxin component YafN of YafNO toxin-antitoxin module
MLDAVIDTRNIYSLTDFLRNYKTHIAQMKETHTPKVLTVNGRAELVMLDTETYENMVGQIKDLKEVAALRAHMAQALKDAPPQEPVTEAEIERRKAAMRELVQETERLGLYR